MSDTALSETGSSIGLVREVTLAWSADNQADRFATDSQLAFRNRLEALQGHIQDNAELPTSHGMTVASSQSDGMRTDSFAMSSQMGTSEFAPRGRVGTDDESPRSLGSSIPDREIIVEASMSRRLAGALAATAVTPEGNARGGLFDLLHQLVLDSVGFEDTFSDSMRRARNLGVVLSGERLSMDEINALPQVSFQDREPQSCAICLEAYKRGEVLTRLPCCHTFHVDCITTWMRRATRCPLCRTDCAD